MNWTWWISSWYPPILLHRLSVQAPWETTDPNWDISESENQRLISVLLLERVKILLQLVATRKTWIVIMKRKMPCMFGNFKMAKLHCDRWRNCISKGPCPWEKFHEHRPMTIICLVSLTFRTIRWACLKSSVLELEWRWWWIQSGWLKSRGRIGTGLNTQGKKSI